MENGSLWTTDASVPFTFLSVRKTPANGILKCVLFVNVSAAFVWCAFSLFHRHDCISYFYGGSASELWHSVPIVLILKQNNKRMRKCYIINRTWSNIWWKNVFASNCSNPFEASETPCSVVSVCRTFGFAKFSISVAFTRQQQSVRRTLKLGGELHTCAIVNAESVYWTNVPGARQNPEAKEASRERNMVLSLRPYSLFSIKSTRGWTALYIYIVNGEVVQQNSRPIIHNKYIRENTYTRCQQYI